MFGAPVNNKPPNFPLLPPDVTMGAPNFFNPNSQGMPPPPPIVDIPVDQDLEDSAFKFFSNFCKTSALYVQSKAPRLDLFRKLYNGEIGIREWEQYKKDPTKEITNIESLEHLSNYIYPIAPNINTLANSIFLQIFSGPEWFTVSSETSVGGPTAPGDIPTAYKLQQLLKDLLHKGDVETLTLQAIIQCILYGTVCAKVNWFEYSVKRLELSQSPRIVSDLVYSCPTISPIPLNLWLPDASATHTDVQRWRAIGHRVVRPYHEILEGFNQGLYNLNIDKFVERFENAQSSMQGYDTFGGIDHDIDADVYQESGLSLPKLWEVHGKYPSKYGLIEGSATIATEIGSLDPEDGILIRLRNAPSLESGLRPFVLAHYTEQPGPFGKGMIEENEANLFITSQFIGQIQDVARYTGTAARMVRQGSSTERWIDENGRIKPGDCIPFDNDNDLREVPNPNSDVSVLNLAKSDMLRIVERDTGVTDTFSGVSGSSRITATHAAALDQQSQLPATARGYLFGQKFIERAWNLALGLISQWTTRERQIIVRNYDGQDQPVIITPEEIKQSKWKVQPSLTSQDSLSVAKAQSLERILGLAPNVKQVMQSEGRNLSISEIVQRYFDALKLGNVDRIVQVLGTQEQMLFQQVQQLSQQNTMMMEELQKLQKKQGPEIEEPEEKIPNKGNESEQQQKQPTQLVQNGGPMGDVPTDQNAMAQFLQMNASPQGGIGG